jgi:DNA-binding MarR family transcriptional regulator/GNAT superfamily N-acetyltransferase
MSERNMPSKARPMNAQLDRSIEAWRRFNRFYTTQVGALEEHLLDSPFSLPEARVLYEVANGQQVTATQITHILSLDAGYLSRILRHLMKAGLVERKTSKEDRRRGILSLTRKGREAFARLDESAKKEVEALLTRLSPEKEKVLLEAMAAIEQVLGPEPDKPKSYVLRAPEPGDLGWIVSRHGALYASEYGWNERFEALVAEIVSQFANTRDAERERGWIAEVDGAPAGSVLVTKASATVAQLRLLLVEPGARGLGIGRRLIDECIRFARRAGYRRLRLWTQSNLRAARHLYENMGFELVEEERHNKFGPELTGELWERKL